MKNPYLKKLFKTTMYKRYKNERLVLSANSAIVPEIGMGATTGAGSDCYPHTIIEIADDLSYIIIQRDNTFCLPGNTFGSQQNYTYSSALNGARAKYTLRKNGRYMLDGVPMKHYFQFVHIGDRRFYQDPSF